MKLSILSLSLAVLLCALMPCGAWAQERVVPMPNRQQMEAAHVRVLFQDSEGYLWYGMKSDGLYRDDGYSLMLFRPDFLHPDVQLNKNITAICEDKHNRIWVGTKRGLYILDKQDYSTKPTTDKKLLTWTIDALKAGEGDTVWAYANKHLLAYDGEGNCVRQTPVEENPLVTADRKQVTDQRGNVWQIDDDGIVTIQKRFTIGLEEVDLASLPLRYTVPNKRVTMPPGQNIHSVWQAEDGTKWVGTSMGLWMLRPDSEDGEAEQVGPNYGVVNTVSPGADGTIYMNTEWQGLVSYKDGRVTRLDTTIRNASGLFLDKKDLWICTADGRLLLYNVENENLTDKSVACCLRGDAPLDLLVVKGNVWLLFNQRLLIYSPAKNVIRYIYPSDLDPQPAFYRRIYTDGAGRVYLECEKKCFEIQMKRASEQKKRKDKIALAAYQTIYGMQCPGMDTHHLDLTAEERVVHLFFTTFDHLNRQHVRFAYRRDGEANWRYLEMGQNDIRLTKLSKGEQTVEVKATNADGQWGEEVFTMTIHCEPHWWETTWAYIGYALVALGLLAFSFWLGKKFGRKLRRRSAA